MQPRLQKGDPGSPLALIHQQGAEFGACVGVARPFPQLGFHRLAQQPGLPTVGQQLRPVARVQQGWFGALGDAPVGLAFQQLRHAVVDHGVIRPAPAQGRMAAEQAAHAGVGRLQRPLLLPQQGDHQQLGPGHELQQRPAGFGAEPFIGIEHQHPVAPHQLQGPVARRGEVAGPGHRGHHSPAAFSDRHRVVAGAGVEHHHLVHEAGHRGQSRINPLGLIAHDHREAEPGVLGGGRLLRQRQVAHRARLNR